MKRQLRTLLERACAGELSPAEQRHLDEILVRRPELCTWLDEQHAVETAVRRAAYRRAGQIIDPYFSTRVLAAVQAVPRVDLAAALLPLFKRVVVAALLLIGVLATYVMQTTPYEAEQTAVERVLALPPTTLDTADEFALVAEELTAFESP